jgi:hypothetical protein
LAAGTIANELSDVFHTAGESGLEKGTDRIAPSPDSAGKGNLDAPLPAPDIAPDNEPEPHQDEPKSAPVPIPESSETGGGGMYQMVKGDNPWDLVEEKHFEGKFEGMSPSERDHVIDSAMDRLRADEALRERIFPGYEWSRATDFTDMPIGQSVNLDAYEKLIDEELVRQGHGTDDFEEEEVEEPEEEKEIHQDTPKATPEAVPENVPEAREAEYRYALQANPETLDVQQNTANTEGIEQTAQNVGGLTNEEPSTNIEDRRTPEQVATQDSEYRSMMAVVHQRDELYRALGDQVQNAGFFNALFGAPQTSAHQYLADMKLSDVQELSKQRPEYIAAIANQQGVAPEALQNWMNYMQQLSNDIATRSPEMKFRAYVDVIAEELAKQNAQARNP